MKKILILGNGFDLDLGRKTSYKNFYESDFCPNDYPAPLIKHLNEKWHNNLETVKWYDLENEILNYYEKIEHKEITGYDLYNEKEKELLKRIKQYPTHTSYSIIQDNLDVINRLLADNILSLSSNNHLIVHPDAFLSPVERDVKAIQKIKYGLMKYLEGIQGGNIKEDSVAAAIVRTFAYNYEHLDEYTVYSFNYMTLHSIYNRNAVDTFNDITQFVHGAIKDSNIIIGTKDYKISPEYDFIQKSFDPQFNPPTLGVDLLLADDITIFGHSLGVNDSQYFKPFFEQQSQMTAKKKTITIFTKDEKSEMQIKRALQEMTNWNLSALYSMNDLQIIKTDTCNEDKTLLRKYVERFCDDEYYIGCIMSGEDYNRLLGQKIFKKKHDFNKTEKYENKGERDNRQ